ncbi:DUF1616 domain-containing protein [Halocatena pleomorpha]|uniref:DUF1616 domain-containing protein n=1 Tax=Halocatena pleomorpha TaxID=1785090 RepID=A0A3P3RAK7_9EURY|nr:DUF1616 domain-containing protein [Halocatena pleomorpha]RRJ29463.1 DUF1616 domain-containing protein [Halocatena pleomorpha]
MPRDVDLTLLLPRPVRTLPADLAANCLLVLLTLAVVLIPGLDATPIRALVGFAFVLFPSGYAFIATLFPEAGGASVETSEGGKRDESKQSSWFDTGIDGLERVALSFGTSIAIVPLIGLLLDFTPWGIRLVPVLLSLSAFTLCMTAAGAVRRNQLPKEERFSVPYRRWFGRAWGELFESNTRADAVLSAVLILSILLATASATYAIAASKQGESFSEFYVLTKNDDGKLVASNYPKDFSKGESKSVIVGIENHERDREDYSVVVLLQNVTMTDNSTVVNDQQRLQRFQTTLGQNKTWRTTHKITPRMTGERLRVLYLLYKDGVPANPIADNAYREAHLWVNVTAGHGTTPPKRLVPSQ